MTRKEFWAQVFLLWHAKCKDQAATLADAALAEYDKRFGETKQAESVASEPEVPSFEMPDPDPLGTYRWPDGSRVTSSFGQGWFAMLPLGHPAHDGFLATAREAARELYRRGFGPGANRKETP